MLIAKVGLDGHDRGAKVIATAFADIYRVETFPSAEPALAAMQAGLPDLALLDIGLPGMDREHVFRTIALNKRAGSDSSIVSIFVPFPDNELTKSLLAKGMIDSTDIKYSKGTAPNVEIAEMSAEEIVGLFRTFNIYTKVPRALYPLIRPLERDNRVTRAARQLLIRFLR